MYLHVTMCAITVWCHCFQISWKTRKFSANMYLLDFHMVYYYISVLYIMLFNLLCVEEIIQSSVVIIVRICSESMVTFVE